jgi:hypothetical protein
MRKLLVAATAIFALAACEPIDGKPYNPLDYADLVIEGKGYMLKTRCVKEVTRTTWCYHYGWSTWKMEFCWHWGYDDEQVCLKEVTDTIPM